MRAPPPHVPLGVNKDNTNDDKWISLLSRHYPLTLRYWRAVMYFLLQDVVEDDISETVLDVWCVEYIAKPYQQYQLPELLVRTGDNKIEKLNNLVQNENWILHPGVPPSGVTNKACMQPRRVYHVLSHVESMLLLWDGYKQHSSPSLCKIEDENDACLCLSLFFHDVVYDARRSDNEEKSVDWFQCFWEACVLSAVRGTGSTRGGRIIKPVVLEALNKIKNTTSEWILQTKHHLKVDAIYDPERDALTGSSTKAADYQQSSSLHVFLDLDLSILGLTPFHKYRTLYANLIEEEYKFLGRTAYLNGRLHFLESVFLPHKQWYKTSYFYHKFEVAARNNVAQEVQLLKNRQHHHHL